MAKKETSVQAEEVETTVDAVEAVESAKPAKASKKKAEKTKTDFSDITEKDVAKMRHDYFQYRLNVSLGKESNTAKLTLMRRDIAKAIMHLNMNKQK